MTIPQSVKTLLGFAHKSGRVLSGEAAVEAGVKKRKACLILMAQDMPAKRKQHYMRWFDGMKIGYFILGTKMEYGDLLGLSPRSILAVSDQQLAAAIVKQIGNQDVSDQYGGD